MRILVTGGAGFIGSHIVEYHLAKGDEVVAVDNLSTGTLNNLANFDKHSSFKFIQSDILNWPEIDTYTAWADRIYHMAAVLGVFRVIAEPIEMLRTNITGTDRVLRSMVESHSKARILIASSSSAYGTSPQHSLKEEDSLVISPNMHPSMLGYAVSKIADEAFGQAYFHAYHLPITFIRFFNTIGPRQTGVYGMVVPRFIQQACRGEPLTVYGDGTQTRSFCDVRDSIILLDIIAEKNLCLGKPINVGRDAEISINDLANLVCERAKSQSTIKYIPYKEAYGNGFFDIKQRRPDISQLRELTGFKHHWTLEKTVDDLIEKFLAHQKISMDVS